MTEYCDCMLEVACDWSVAYTGARVASGAESRSKLREMDNLTI